MSDFHTIKVVVTEPFTDVMYWCGYWDDYDNGPTYIDTETITAMSLDPSHDLIVSMIHALDIEILTTCWAWSNLPKSYVISADPGDGHYIVLYQHGGTS